MARDPVAFRTFAVDTPRTAATLKAQLQQRKNTDQSLLHTAMDWADYKQRVGIIRGLDIAINLCDDMAEKERE